MGKERSEINLQYDRQLQNQQDQNNWQSSENSVDRQWQADQWQRQFESQMQVQRELFDEQLGKQRESDFQKWKDQFDIQNQYNSPQNQVARLMSAGVNPSAAISALTSGISSAGIGGSSSPSGASAPSGGSVGSHSVSPLGISMPNYSTDAALWSSAAQMIDSVSKIAERGYNIFSGSKQLQPTVDNILADTKQKQNSATMTETNNAILSAYGDKKAAAEVQKLTNESYELETQGKVNEAQATLNKAEEKFTESKTLANEEQRPVVLSNMEKLGDLYDSEKAVNKSQQAVNFARVDEIKSQTEYNQIMTQVERDLKDGKVTSQTLSNGVLALQYGLQKNEKIMSDRTFENRYFSIINECQSKGYISETLRIRALDAITHRKYTEVREILNLLQGSVDIGSGLAAPLLKP